MTTPEAPTAAPPRNELTWRGVILGVLITLIFTAANVYFGLKAALTFASSIPAAVISMAVLRAFKGATIQENNIVQTVASAAGALSSVVFVLPGLVMIGWWTHFPFWETFAICALGGVLGVTFSIPLRRALVTNSDLPYPEGVACAEVLKVGVGVPDPQSKADIAAEAAGKAGLLALLVGAISAALFSVVVATQVFAGNIARTFRIGSTASGADYGFSLALMGVGHLIGLWPGLAILLGLLISWAAAVPILFAMHPHAADLAAAVDDVWRHQVRFIGAGQIGVAAIWSLIKLAKPVLGGLASAIAASRARRADKNALLPLMEQDLPIGWTGVITVVCMAGIGLMLAYLAAQSGLGLATVPLVVGGMAYVLVIGLFVCTVCAYMAGLVGSSNSPVSGVGILAVLIAAVLIAAIIRPLIGNGASNALVAFSLFATAFVFAAAVVGNDNMQDLKTGQLVGATPWKQQVALIIGVVAGAAVIPVVLDLLNRAYGFAGAPGADPAHALGAPQAALISTLAKGVIQGDLNLTMLGIGVVVGVLVVAFDELLGRRGGKARIAPLAVGLGIYLPMGTTAPIVAGAIIGAIYDRLSDRSARAEAKKQLGILMASGLIVGEGLMGVILAAVVVATGLDAPLALVGAGFKGVSEWLGLAALIASMLGLYVWTAELAKKG